MRRKAALTRTAVLLATVALVAAACSNGSDTSPSESAGSSAPAPSGEITFLVSSTPTVDNLIKMIPQFTAQTGIKVNVANIDYDAMTQKETLDLRSKTGQYDVFWVEGTFLARYVGQLNGLEPIGDYATSQNVDLKLSDFPQSLIDNFSVDSTLYAVPFENTLMMQANRDDLYKQAGLSPATTLPEYLSNVAALNAPPSHYGTEIMGQQGEPIFYEWVNWLWGEGGDLFDSSGAPTLDTPQAVKATNDLLTLAKSAPPGVANYSWDQAATSFATGDVSTAVLFSDQTPGLLDPANSKVIGKWSYAPFPGDKSTAFGGYAWAMNASSANKPAALAFIDWATSAETLSKLVPDGSSPPRTSVQDDPSLQEKYPWLSAEAAASGRAIVPIKNAAYFDLVDALSTDLNAALTGSMTPDAAMADAQKKWEQILASQ
jgi:multiple sugar transport system substrate-binding protein